MAGSGRGGGEGYFWCVPLTYVREEYVESVSGEGTIERCPEAGSSDAQKMRGGGMVGRVVVKVRDNVSMMRVKVAFYKTILGYMGESPN